MSPNLALGLALVTSLTLTACGSRLDARQVESLIQADIERQGRRLSVKEVRCPSDIPQQAGETFRCVGELDPKGSFIINVTQGDGQGQIRWDVPNSSTLINLAKVETSIQQGLGKALGKAAVIDCGPATYRLNQPGDRFQCQIRGRPYRWPRPSRGGASHHRPQGQSGLAGGSPQLPSYPGD
jgi:hypothetical protein